MTAQQLINQLQAIIKRNPKAANKKIVMDQYDCAEAHNVGYVEASQVDDMGDRVELA